MWLIQLIRTPIQESCDHQMALVTLLLKGWSNAITKADSSVLIIAQCGMLAHKQQW